jgi:hypothetical protein
MFGALEAIVKLRKELDAGEAAWLREVAAYDRSHDWQADGYFSAASALRHACHLSVGVARAHVELARKLEALPEVAAAFDDGEISARHATVIANAYTPERAEKINEIERALVDYARETNPHDLGAVVRRVTDALDGDGGAAADEEDYERRALYAARTLLGAFDLRANSDALSGEIVETALKAEMARDLQAGDTRRTAQRRLDALVNICRRDLDRGEGGEIHGVRPHVSVVIHINDTAAPDLVARARAERHYGGRLSQTMVEMLACDCDVSRVIVAGRSEILDVGRATPTATPAQWKALVARDGQCQAPGCNRPPSDCHAHHIRHWTDGGPTDLQNLELLCWYHHRQRHIEEAEARARGANRDP